MPPDPLTDDDEQYVSADDSDFAPDEAPGIASSDSEAEGEAEAPTSKKRKQASAADRGDAIDDADADNSGDEAIVNRGKKRLKRSKDVLDDEEGGEGGLVKTRAQRAQEKEERKYKVNNEPVTVDVDALWEQMKVGKTFTPPSKDAPSGEAEQKDTEDQTPKDADTDMIRIKRTYNFAGKVHTEEKLVARDSAEAKLYLESEGDKALDASPPKRATRKAFRSAFEPITDSTAKRTDLNLGLAARLMASKEAEAKKLNTVEKSRMDWAGYVDKTGIKDELKLAGKSKHSYAARQDFLARSEAIRDEESRRARMAGRT